MAIHFLIGGTGNQLFQYTASKEGDKFSMVLLHPISRKLLNWTNHEQILDYPSPNFIQHTLSISLLLIDLVLFKIAKKTLITELDLRKGKCTPIFRRQIYLGYAQEATPQQDLEKIRDQLLSTSSANKTRDMVIHIRGGDLKTGGSFNNTYGSLRPAYYATAISLIHAGKADVAVITDDPQYAKEVMTQAAPEIDAEILTLPLRETITTGITATNFISSNSTLSYWICQLRKKGLTTIAPRPFQRNKDFNFKETTTRAPSGYEQ
jgi:hypothetical protein